MYYEVIDEFANEFLSCTPDDVIDDFFRSERLSLERNADLESQSV